jgi:hypothetical protein
MVERMTRAGVASSLLTAAMLLVPSWPAAVAQSAVTAAQAPSADTLRDVRGEWKRAGAGFACAAKMPQQLTPAQLEALITRTCLHLGPLVIGDAADRAIAALGQPHRTLNQPKGRVAWIYFLGQRDHYPYFIVTVETNKVVALQVTGETAAPGYDFNHVTLGASADDLLQVFGQPSHFEPSELKDAELWTYPPHPFSFELKSGRVISIRIREP